MTSDTGSVTWTIDKCQCDVCWLRLDFDTFNILGTGATTETDGGVCLDDLTITSTNPNTIPTICGQNAGQHIYVDVGDQCSDSATLTFNFDATDATTGRSWEIKVTQVECWNQNAPPDCCLQYYTGLTGRFETFNYNGGNGESHLANQDYSACIRQECGYCCIQYQECETGSFTLDSNANPAGDQALDTMCTLDYIGLPESDITCSTGAGSTNLNNRYCSMTFGGQVAPIAVCDCTPPFLIDVFTDSNTDVDVANTPNTVRSQGACIQWQQLPC